MPVAARVRLNADGTFNVMTGKVEEGQGPRAQLTQAAAEENDAFYGPRRPTGCGHGPRAAQRSRGQAMEG
jgi:hypothetical protein